MEAADSSRTFLTPRMHGTGIRPLANLHVIGLSQQGDQHQRVNSPRLKNQPAPHRHHYHASCSSMNSCLPFRYGSQPQDTWQLQGCRPASLSLQSLHQAPLQSQRDGHLHAVKAQRELQVWSC